MSMIQEKKPTRRSRLAMPDRAEKARLLTSSIVSLLPTSFVWTDEEAKKIESVAEELNCTPAVAQQMLIFFLVYISTYQKEFSVSDLPQILHAFPVKWGYKKKRHDFDLAAEPKK